jgi:hypothetical protein
VHSMENNPKSHFRKLNRELLEIVVRYLYSEQHATIVYSMLRLNGVSRYYHQLQCVDDEHALGLEKTSDSDSSYKFIREQLQREADVAIHRGFRICLRKRPLSEFEVGTNIYDCIETRSLSDLDIQKVSGCTNCVTAHDGRKARTGRRIHMDHRHFFFDRVWDEHTPNSDVCNSEIRRLIDWANEGFNSTMVCFGQVSAFHCSCFLQQFNG